MRQSPRVVPVDTTQSSERGSHLAEKTDVRPSPEQPEQVDQRTGG